MSCVCVCVAQNIYLSTRARARAFRRKHSVPIHSSVHDDGDDATRAGAGGVLCVWFLIVPLGDDSYRVVVVVVVPSTQNKYTFVVCIESARAQRHTRAHRNKMQRDPGKDTARTHSTPSRLSHAEKTTGTDWSYVYGRSCLCGAPGTGITQSNHTVVVYYLYAYESAA